MISEKYEDLGLKLLNFNIININIDSSKIKNAIENTQIYDQQISKMEFLKNSKTLQLQYLQSVNQIYDTVNQNNEITKGKVKNELSIGKGQGKSSLYENVNGSITNIQTSTNNYNQTFLFVYLSIFKNTFNKTQNVFVTKNPY